MKIGNPQTPYRQALSIEQAYEGIISAIENAKDLLAEANLLLENQHWARACALAILAIEETGKEGVIFRILLADDEKELKSEWKLYRDHRFKNLSWIIPRLLDLGIIKREELRHFFASNRREHTFYLDRLKQKSFYSDITSDGVWRSPKYCITEDQARAIISAAKDVVGSAPGPLSTREGLELWVKHLKTINKDNQSDWDEAFWNCFMEAKSRGLWDEEELELFLGKYFRKS